MRNPFNKKSLKEASKKIEDTFLTMAVVLVVIPVEYAFKAVKNFFSSIYNISGKAWGKTSEQVNPRFEKFGKAVSEFSRNTAEKISNAVSTAKNALISFFNRITGRTVAAEVKSEIAGVPAVPAVKDPHIAVDSLIVSDTKYKGLLFSDIKDQELLRDAKYLLDNGTLYPSLTYKGS